MNKELTWKLVLHQQFFGNETDLQVQVDVSFKSMGSDSNNMQEKKNYFQGKLDRWRSEASVTLRELGCVQKLTVKNMINIVSLTKFILQFTSTRATSDFSSITNSINLFHYKNSIMNNLLSIQYFYNVIKYNASFFRRILKHSRSHIALL